MSESKKRKDAPSHSSSSTPSSSSSSKKLKSETKVEEKIRRSLGECLYPSPLDTEGVWIDSKRVVFHYAQARGAHKGVETPIDELEHDQELLELAGPRKELFFDPSNLKVGVVSCGGLCPGMNNVIRDLVMCLWYSYGVRDIIGLKFGFQGLSDKSETLVLSPVSVKEIHHFGGTLLGTSRGPQPTSSMVDFLVEHKFNILFGIGGDGTLKGIQSIAEEVNRRGLKISIIAIPKTIDNDVPYTETSFGFQTAIQQAQTAISSAHCEARSAENGIGLVKLMGRDAGFIALHATLASGDVNLCLIPEVKFSIEKVTKYIHTRLQRAKHMVIVVSEGAGQELCPGVGTDASGNIRHGDIGEFLIKSISAALNKEKMVHTIKYIDPSYTVRSSVANSTDAIYCMGLAHSAAHAAMAGRTGIMVSYLNSHFVHVPLERATRELKRVDVGARDYRLMLASTGQPVTSKIL